MPQFSEQQTIQLDASHSNPQLSNRDCADIEDFFCSGEFFFPRNIWFMSPFIIMFTDVSG